MLRSLLAFFTLALILGLSFSRTQIQSYQETKQKYQTSELNVFYSDGTEFGSARSDLNARKGAWLPLAEIQPLTIKAVLYSEDRNFYKHFGFDGAALVASLWQRFKYSSPRGGSTVSMQLVKLLLPTQNWRGYLGKLNQLWFAVRLESKWSKEEILEAYLNLVPLRGELRGISAAQKLFRLNTKDWDLIDSVLFAAQLRSPNANWNLISTRACDLHSKLADEKVECSVISYRAEYLAKFNGDNEGRVNHFVEFLRQQSFIGTYRSAVHPKLQKFAEASVEEQLQKLSSRNVRDAAVLVLDNRTGKVLAYVGGGRQTNAKYVDGVQALRQAGSTLKPFLYALSFERKLLQPDSWLEDSPMDVNLGSGSYRPRNHDKNYSGWVRAAYALGSSLNIPAIRTVGLLGYENLWSALQKMQFRKLALADHYGAGIALGVVDVSLWDLTNGFRSLANQGIYSPIPLASLQEKSKTRVFSESAANQISSILSNAEFRKLSFGIYSDLNLPFWAAVKTGTSKDMRDNWCIGYSQDFSVGVWVGNFDGEPMWDVLGTTGAAPIWRDVMIFAHEKIKAQSRPEHIPELQMSNQLKNFPVAKILYPSEGLILAVDPAIPKFNQKIPLQVNNPLKEELSWKIDGKVFAEKYWPVQRGKHTLQLMSKQGVEVDRVSIVVK